MNSGIYSISNFSAGWTIVLKRVLSLKTVTNCLIWNDLRNWTRITNSILILLAFHSNPVLFYWKSEPEGIDFVHPSPCHGLSNKTKAWAFHLENKFSDSSTGFCFVNRKGFEPLTHSLEGCCSIQLSYRSIFSKTFAKLRYFFKSTKLFAFRIWNNFQVVWIFLHIRRFFCKFAIYMVWLFWGEDRG